MKGNKKMKKNVMKGSKTVLTALLTMGITLWLAGSAFSEIRIGVIGSQTSPLAILGQRQVNSAILAASHWNDRGGIRGEKIRLVIEDSADTTTTAITALDRILARNVCAVLGPIYSFQLFAMFPEIEKERIPMLTTSGTRELTLRNNPWYFRTYPHDGITKQAATLYVLDELKKTRPALACVTTEYGKSGYEIITGILKARGITPVAATWHDKNDKDMTGQLQQIKRAEPDVIISQAHPSDTAILLKQQRDMGIDVPHMASSAASMPSVHALVGSAMDGVYVETAALPDVDPDPKIQAWTKSYLDRFHTSPDSFALLFYDTAEMLFEAIHAVGPDPKNIRDHLQRQSYQGLAGLYAFDAERNGAFFAAIAQYRILEGRVVPEMKKKYDFTPAALRSAKNQD